MNPEGVARFFARGMMNEGPFPEHYEPFETPIGTNPMHPTTPRPSPTRPRGCSKATWKPSAPPGLPLRRHHLPAHRALPLLDQARRMVNAITQPEQFVEIGEALAAERASRPATRSGELQPRLHQGGGGGHQAHQTAAGGRENGASRRDSRSTGASRGGQERLHHQHLTPFVGDGNADAGVQILPRQRRESLRRPPWHCNHWTSPSARPPPPVAPGTQDPRGRQADRRLQVHRLQGLPGGVHAVERPA